MIRNISFFVLIISGLFVFSACNGGEGSDNPDPSEVAKVKADPESAKEMKEKMNGRWRATEDPKSVVTFAGSKMTSMYNGRIVSEKSIEFFKSCPEACSSELNLKGTPCFTARGQYDATCFAIVELGENKLSYSMIGGRGNTLAFERVTE